MKPLEELDILFCELVSNLILYQPLLEDKKRGRSAGNLDVESVVEIVKQYILKSLSGTVSLVLRYGRSIAHEDG